MNCANNESVFLCNVDPSSIYRIPPVDRYDSKVYWDNLKMTRPDNFLQDLRVRKSTKGVVINFLYKGRRFVRNFRVVDNANLRPEPFLAIPPSVAVFLMAFAEGGVDEEVANLLTDALDPATCNTDYWEDGAKRAMGEFYPSVRRLAVGVLIRTMRGGAQYGDREQILDQSETALAMAFLHLTGDYDNFFHFLCRGAF